MVGLLILILVFGIGWADWWTLTNPVLVVRVLWGSLGAVAVILIIMGILNSGKGRWIDFLLATFLLLGFSVFDIVTLGIIGAPVCLFLVAFCIWKLTHWPPKPVSCC
jgi:hypothetical protein